MLDARGGSLACANFIPLEFARVVISALSSCDAGQTAFVTGTDFFERWLINARDRRLHDEVDGYIAKPAAPAPKRTLQPYPSALRRGLEERHCAAIASALTR
jgi:hypothetical protein